MSDRPLNLTESNDLIACRRYLRKLLRYGRPRGRLASRADTVKIARCGKPLLDEVNRLLEAEGLAEWMREDDERNPDVC